MNTTAANSLSPPPFTVGSTPTSSSTLTTRKQQVQTDYFGPRAYLQDKRLNSYSSNFSSSSSSPTSPTSKSSSWLKPSPTTNVHTTCGRHTDQLLFGGPSLSEWARRVWRRAQ